MSEVLCDCGSSVCPDCSAAGTPDHHGRGTAASLWWSGLQAAAALVLVMVGVTMFLAGGRLLGAVLIGAAGAWLWRCSAAL